jgi:adenine/guanine/hypoxanthine permease
LFYTWIKTSLLTTKDTHSIFCSFLTLFFTQSVPIAGIGFAFLGLEQLTYSIAAPIVGYNAILWVYLGWYSGVKLGYGQYRIPEAMMVILVGCILGWMTGLNQPSETQKAAQLVRWWGPAWTAGDLFSDFALVKDYLGIVIPIGISAAATTLMCLVSAKEAGDPYPVRETMITDGIGTCLASFFGSPFGTVIYIGHPVHKRNGARVGYSLCNGLIYWYVLRFVIIVVVVVVSLLDRLSIRERTLAVLV